MPLQPHFRPLLAAALAAGLALSACADDGGEGDLVEEPRIDGEMEGGEDEGGEVEEDD